MRIKVCLLSVMKQQNIGLPRIEKESRMSEDENKRVPIISDEGMKQQNRGVLRIEEEIKGVPINKDKKQQNRGVPKIIEEGKKESRENIQQIQELEEAEMFSALKYRDQDVKEVKPSGSSKSRLKPNDNRLIPNNIQFDDPSVENIPGQNSVMTSKVKRTVDKPLKGSPSLANNIIHSQPLIKKNSAESKRLKRSLSHLSPSLLSLMENWIPRNRNTLAQLNLLNFNFSTNTLKDHKKYINEVIEGSNDISVKEMMMSSLNPDLIQRGKVCGI